MIPDLYPDQDATDTRIISIVSELKISDVSQWLRGIVVIVAARHARDLVSNPGRDDKNL